VDTNRRKRRFSQGQPEKEQVRGEPRWRCRNERGNFLPQSGFYHPEKKGEKTETPMTPKSKEENGGEGKKGRLPPRWENRGRLGEPYTGKRGSPRGKKGELGKREGPLLINKEKKKKSTSSWGQGVDWGSGDRFL